MPKTNAQFDPVLYAPVADRVALFWAAYPAGRIDTVLHSRVMGEVTFVARVYRDAADERAASTGWASEREGDGEINTVACLENTETSAIGRALANMGLTAARARPSLEEMQKTTRVRARVSRVASPPSPPYRGQVDEALQARADGTLALLKIIDEAHRAGLRIMRADRWRQQLLRGRPLHGRLEEWATRLSEWSARQA